MGPYVLLMLQPPQGQSIPVVWRGPASVASAGVMEATGDLDTDGYMQAVSIQAFEAPKPIPEKPRLYFMRAFGSAFLGDILAFFVMAWAHTTAVTWTVIVILGIGFSAGLAWRFAPKNRKANAVVGGAMACLIYLCLYLLTL